MQGARFMPDPSWSVLESEDGKRFTIDCDGGPMLPRKVIATVYNSRRVDGKANARLIAAAPTMLDALRDAEHALTVYVNNIRRPETHTPGNSLFDDALSAVRSAINKATGGAR